MHLSALCAGVYVDMSASVCYLMMDDILYPASDAADGGMPVDTDWSQAGMSEAVAIPANDQCHLKTVQEDLHPCQMAAPTALLQLGICLCESRVY